MKNTHTRGRGVSGMYDFEGETNSDKRRLLNSRILWKKEISL